jgi:PIN domain
MANENLQKVFVDANFWIQFGHNFSSAEAASLEELVELRIARILVTDLTISEIAKRFTKHDFEKLELFSKKEVRDAAKRHLNHDIPVIDRDALRQSIFDTHMRDVSTQLRNRFKVIVLSIDSVRPSHILNDYTHSKGLFSASSKRDQFPDAFIFGAISTEAKEDDNIIVLTGDGDFADAAKNAENLRRVASFPALFDDLGVRREDDSVIERIEEKAESFVKPLAEMLGDYLIDVDDVEDADIEVLNVTKVDISVRIAYRINQNMDTYIAFAKADVEAEVYYRHPDWDGAAWDSEDKVLIPFDTIDGTADVEIDDIPFSFIIQFNDDKSVTITGCEIKGNSYISTTLHPTVDYY